jgi:hypothetical protein
MSYLSLKNVKSSGVIGQVSFRNFEHLPISSVHSEMRREHREKIRGSADFAIANERSPT